MNRWFVWAFDGDRVLAAIVDDQVEVGKLQMKYSSDFQYINVRRCK